LDPFVSYKEKELLLKDALVFSTKLIIFCHSIFGTGNPFILIVKQAAGNIPFLQQISGSVG
jgi:hypothetical protein